MSIIVIASANACDGLASNAEQGDNICFTTEIHELLHVQANQAVEALKVSGDKKAAADQIKALYETFVKSDCTMVEVHTQALTRQKISAVSASIKSGHASLKSPSVPCFSEWLWGLPCRSTLWLRRQMGA